MAQGDLRGTLTGTGGSQLNPSPCNGSVTVSVNDLIHIVFTQQTATSVGAGGSKPTDNLGNVYTWCNVGTDPGTPTARAAWSIATASGTLTNVSATAIASANNFQNHAQVIQGPFAVNAAQPAANPANGINDVTSPFACPATGVLPQTECAVVSFYACVTNITVTATPPNLRSIQGQQAATNHLALGYQKVSSTSSVIPNFTSTTNPTGNSILGTTAFKLHDLVNCSPTLGPATLSSAVTAAAGANTASLSATLGAATAAAAVSVPVRAAMSATLGAATAAAVASVKANAALSATLGAATLSSGVTAQSSTATASLAATLGSLTGSSAVSADVLASLQAQLGAATLASGATAQASAALASLDAMLGAATLSSGASVGGPVAALSATLGAILSSAQASIEAHCDLDVELGPMTLAGSAGSGGDDGPLHYHFMMKRSGARRPNLEYIIQ